jgi:hypothetical protein
MLQALRVTSVLMLLVSINSFSMHNSELNKKLVCSRDIKKEDEKYKEVLLSSPSSVPYFKQQSIALQNNNADHYSLILNRQQPCITQYLLEGKPVAKLIQIDDEINFESNGHRICNFSLQIPYQAGSLTVNTQGRFVFEKKIDTYSACVTCKELDFRDVFLSNNGLIVEADSCKNQAQLACSDFLFKGKELEVIPNSSLTAHNSLTLMSQSLVSNQGTIDCWKDSFIKSSIFKNSGNFASYNMYFDGNEIVNLGTLTIEDTCRCSSKLFSSTLSSVWNVNGDWKAYIDSFFLNGSCNVKNLHVVGKNFTAEQPLHCIAEQVHLKIEEDVVNAGVIKTLGLLDVDSKNITLEETSCIMADNADFKVDKVIHNDGTLSVKKHLSAHSQCINNTGKIKASSSDIKADRYYYNAMLSTLYAQNSLKINTPLFLNLLGLAHAHDLAINSGVGLNALGVYAAKNMSINSLAALNFGLFIPKFDALSEIYSPENLWKSGEGLFIYYIPFWGKIYTLLKSIKGTCQQGKDLYREINFLRKQKNIGMADKIALLCSMKSMVNAARQTCQLGAQSRHLLSDSDQSQSMQPSEPLAGVVDRVKDVAQQVISTIASNYAPSVTTSSIVDCNYGVALGINNHSSSLYHRNANVSLYAHNTIDTRCGENTGYLGAYNLNINATSSYDLDGNTRVSNGNVEAYHLGVNGPVNAAGNIVLQGKSSAHINGDVTAKKIAVKSDGYTTINSHLTSADTHVRGKVIDQHGVITSQQVHMNGDRITNYGTIKAPKTIVTQAKLPRTSWCEPRGSFFHNKGDMQASEQFFVDAGDVKLLEKSIIDSPNVYFKNDGSWQNNGNINTKQLIINAKGNVTNGGSLLASEQCFVDARNIKLHEKSMVDSPNVYFKANGSWENDGNITAKQLGVGAKSDITNNGSLQASKVIITQEKSDNNGYWANSRAFRNTGSMQVSEQLFVDARNIKLHETSEIDTPNAYFKSDGNWQNDGKLKTEQCIIDAQQRATNNGTVDSSELLSVKAENILFHAKSDIKSKDAYYKANQNVFIDGVMDIERGSVDAGGKVRAIGKIGASDQLDVKAKDIIIQEFSCVTANTVTLKATQTICNQGTLTAPKLSAHANYVTNFGTINSNNAHIKADRCFWNAFGGAINVEDNLTIDTFLLLNTLGYMSADSIYTNSIVDMNLLGIYRGSNICQNSFVNYNVGILIPKFKSLGDLMKSIQKDPWRFTKSFVLPLAEKLVLPFVPKAGKIYSLVKPIAMLCTKEGREASCWNRAGVLKERIEDLCKKEDLCVSDVVPVLCQTKNMVASVVQTGCQVFDAGQQVYEDRQAIYDAGPQAYQTVQNYWNSQSETAENSTLQQKICNAMPTAQDTQTFFRSQVSTIALTAASTAASTAAGILGPQLSRNSLLDVNHCVVLGVNGDSQSLYHMNRGLSFFVNNNSVNTLSGTNTGFIGGGNVSISAFDSYVSNGKTAAANLAMTANNLAITGTTYAFNALLKAHTGAELDRQIKAHHVTVNAKNMLIKENTSIDANIIVLDAQSIQGKEGNAIRSVSGTLIKTNEFDNHGIINGSVTLQFNGEANQLKSIGTVDTLSYNGTLENNIADRLANGRNELLNVAEGGAVVIDAQKQDVHFTEQHDMAHTLYVQTKESIRCDKDLLSNKSILLQADGDVHHESVKSQETTALIGKNIFSEGHVTREHCGDNYTDTCATNKVYGKQVFIKTGNHVRYKGVNVHSGVDGTQLFVGDRLISEASEIEEYLNSEKSDSEFLSGTDTIAKDTKRISIPSTFTSDGATNIYANVAELHGTVFGANDGTTLTAIVEDVPTYDVHSHEKNGEQTGHSEVTTKEEVLSIARKTITFNDKSPTVISSNNPVSMHLAGSTPSITINAPHVEVLVAKKITDTTRSKDGKYVRLWHRKTQEQSHGVTYGSSYSGVINTNAQDFYIEEIKGNAPVIINAVHENAYITRSLIEDLHQYQKQSYNRPTPVAMGIIALSLSIALQGMGSSLGAALVTKTQIESAVFSTMINQATCGAINGLCMEAFAVLCDCNGDVKAAAKELASKKTICNIATKVITAAATGGADKLLDKVIPPLSHATTFGERLAYTAPRELVKGGIRTGGDIAQGKNPKEAVKDRLKSAAANTVGISCSSEIGKVYGDKKIGSGTHKVLHIGLGALQGAILDGKNGAIAGAIGSGVAETIADIACPKQPSLDDIHALEVTLGRRLTQDEFAFEWNQRLEQYLKQTHSVADASKMIAATVAILANQDMDIAYDTATKAVDNNFLALVNYGIFGAKTAYALYQVPQIYEEKGIEEALQYLGVEVGKAGLDLALCRGTEKVVFAVGGKIYPSASAAINVVLDKTPGLKNALGSFTKTLIEAGENFAQTGFGKQVVRAGEYIYQAETTICTAEDKLISNVGNKFIDKVESKVVDKVGKYINSSFAEDLVDHVVPRSVVSKMEAQVGKKAVEKAEITIAQNLGNITKPDLLMTTTEEAKVSGPDVGEVGLFQSMEKMGETGNDIGVIKGELKSVLKETEERLFLEIEHPVVNNIRTGKGLKLDKHHAFPDIIDNFAQQAEKFSIKGGDEILRELYQVEGSLNGQDGIFEWIVDPRPIYGVTHRFFIKNGKITGKPNIW